MSDKNQLHTAIIRHFYPNITKVKCRRLRELARQNKIKWLDDELFTNLDNLLASIVRHTETSYDYLVVVQEKSIARTNVGKTVNEMMKAMRR